MKGRMNSGQRMHVKSRIASFARVSTAFELPKYRIACVGWYAAIQSTGFWNKIIYS